MSIPGLLLDLDRPRRDGIPLLRGSARTIPVRIDRRDELLATSNQGETPHCAAYAMAGAVEYLRWKYEGLARQIDPVPIYDTAKTLDGAPAEDGTSLTAVVQAAEKLRIIGDVDEATIRVIEDVETLKAAVHRYGVVLAGLEIDEGWRDSQRDGWIHRGGRVLGGHAILICAYNSSEKWIGFQNSWGPVVGWKGFGRLTDADFEAQFRYAVVWDYVSPRWI